MGTSLGSNAVGLAFIFYLLFITNFLSNTSSWPSMQIHVHYPSTYGPVPFELEGRRWIGEMSFPHYCNAANLCISSATILIRRASFSLCTRWNGKLFRKARFPGDLTREQPTNVLPSTSSYCRLPVTNIHDHLSKSKTLWLVYCDSPTQDQWKLNPAASFSRSRIENSSIRNDRNYSLAWNDGRTDIIIEFNQHLHRKRGCCILSMKSNTLIIPRLSL